MTVCSKCGNICVESSSYINKITGEVWCLNCITIEKKEREIIQYSKKKT